MNYSINGTDGKFYESTLDKTIDIDIKRLLLHEKSTEKLSLLASTFGMAKTEIDSCFEEAIGNSSDEERIILEAHRKDFSENGADYMYKMHEASLNRLFHHIEMRHPMVFVSSDRSERTRRENYENYRRLISLADAFIRQYPFSYTKIKGGYIEDNGNVIVDENSIVVYGIEGSDKILKEHAMEWGKIFNQECVMFVNSSGNAYFLYCRDVPSDNKLEGELEYVGVFSADLTCEFFTKIRNKRFSFKRPEESEQVFDFSKSKLIEMEKEDKPSLTTRQNKSTYDKFLEKYGKEALLMKEKLSVNRKELIEDRIKAILD